MPRVVLAAAAVLALAVPAPAEAYVVGGRPWPGPSVSYYPGTGAHARAISRAARVWTRAHVGVRLVRSPRRRADVVFRHGGPRCGGFAPVGHLTGYRSRVFLGYGCGQGLITLVAVHELGHVLGLDHELTRCAVMNPWSDLTGTPSRCAHHPLRFWLRRPLRADDLRGARALYGRRARRRRGRLLLNSDTTGPS